MDFTRRLRSGIFIGLLILCAGSLFNCYCITDHCFNSKRRPQSLLAYYLRRSWCGQQASRSPIEEKYGLVEANELSGIWGGITFDQYASITSIPGVDVAAPIAMIGYVIGGVSGDEMPYPAQPGLYMLDQTVTVDDGVRQYTAPGYPSRQYLYSTRSSTAATRWNRIPLPFDWLVINDVPEMPQVAFPSSPLAGIKPAQEAALTGLDQALLAGRYLPQRQSRLGLS